MCVDCVEEEGGHMSAKRLYWCPHCKAWVERRLLPLHALFSEAFMNHGREQLPRRAEEFACLLWAVTASLEHWVNLCLVASEGQEVNRRNAHGDTLLHIGARTGVSGVC